MSMTLPIIGRTDVWDNTAFFSLTSLFFNSLKNLQVKVKMMKLTTAEGFFSGQREKWPRMHDSQFEGLPLTPRAPATTAWVWWWLPAGWGYSAWTGPGLSSSPLPSLSSSDSEVE